MTHFRDAMWFENICELITSTFAHHFATPIAVQSQLQKSTSTITTVTTSGKSSSVVPAASPKPTPTVPRFLQAQHECSDDEIYHLFLNLLLTLHGRFFDPKPTREYDVQSSNAHRPPDGQKDRQDNTDSCCRDSKQEEIWKLDRTNPRRKSLEIEASQRRQDQKLMKETIQKTTAELHATEDKEGLLHLAPSWLLLGGPPPSGGGGGAERRRPSSTLLEPTALFSGSISSSNDAAVLDAVQSPAVAAWKHFRVLIVDMFVLLLSKPNIGDWFTTSMRKPSSTAAKECEQRVAGINDFEGTLDFRSVVVDAPFGRHLSMVGMSSSPMMPRRQSNVVDKALGDKETAMASNSSPPPYDADHQAPSPYSFPRGDMMGNDGTPPRLVLMEPSPPSIPPHRGSITSYSPAAFSSSNNPPAFGRSPSLVLAAGSAAAAARPQQGQQQQQQAASSMTPLLNDSHPLTQQQQQRTADRQEDNSVSSASPSFNVGSSSQPSPVSATFNDASVQLMTLSTRNLPFTLERECGLPALLTRRSLPYMVAAVAVVLLENHATVVDHSDFKLPHLPYPINPKYFNEGSTEQRDRRRRTYLQKVQEWIVSLQEILRRHLCMEVAIALGLSPTEVLQSVLYVEHVILPFQRRVLCMPEVPARPDIETDEYSFSKLYDDYTVSSPYCNIHRRAFFSTLQRKQNKEEHAKALLQALFSH